MLVEERDDGYPERERDVRSGDTVHQHRQRDHGGVRWGPTLGGWPSPSVRCRLSDQLGSSGGNVQKEIECSSRYARINA